MKLGTKYSAKTYSMVISDDVCQLTIPLDPEIDLIVHTVGYGADWQAIKSKTVYEAIEHMKIMVQFSIDHDQAYHAFWEQINNETNGVEEIASPSGVVGDSRLAKHFDQMMHPDDDTMHWYIGRNGVAGDSAYINGPNSDKQSYESMLLDLQEFQNRVKDCSRLELLDYVREGQC